MSEEKKKALPRMPPMKPQFTPKFVQPKKINPLPSMPTSMSHPVLSDYGKKPSQAERPRRPPREKEMILIDKVVPSRAPAASLYNPIMPKISQADNDLIDDAVGQAIQLPLAKNDKQTPINEVFKSENGPKYLLFVLPSSLPIKYPNDSAADDSNPLSSATDGIIGKLQIHKSGKVTAKLGNLELDVSTGILSSCSQLVCFKSENQIETIPQPSEKVKLTVNINRLKKSISDEK